jgi:hypothetical protein
MYTNRRRVRLRISDDFVMRDVMAEMRDLRVSVLRASASRMSLSHVVSDGGLQQGRHIKVLIVFG